MDEFNQFRAGKIALGNLRSTNDEELILYYKDQILYQIEQNGHIKQRYESLLQNVSNRFRTQLNAWVMQ